MTVAVPDCDRGPGCRIEGCPVHGDHQPVLHGMSRLEAVRDHLPDAVGKLTQLVVDNPAQFALIGAGTIVATRAAVNIVRPRTPLEGLALMVLLQVGLPMLAGHAVRAGWLRMRVRDENGCLVPLEPGDFDAGRPDPAG